MSATEYFEYYKEYTEKYGEKTLVLIQNGAFYEMYAFKNDDEDLNYTNLKEISEIMDIVLTKKNKKKEVTLKSPYMAGIPIKAIDKYIRKISEHNYTIVLVDQITEPPRPERAVVEVISPGTSIRKETLKSHTNYLLSIYIESEENDMYAGVSAIDLSTGKSIVLETYSDEADVNLALDEIYRCIKCHNPREIIIYDTTDNKNFLLRYLEIEDKAIQYYNTIPIKYTKVSYQNKFLEKIFEDTGMISPIVYLQLEYNPFARISYIIALDFAHNHNERIVKHIEKPIIWESSNHLVLTLNSLEEYENPFHVKYIIIEEAQFFNDLYQFVIHQIDILEKNIIVVGLDGDSNRQNFGEIHKLLPICDEIIKLKAYCSICKNGTLGIFSTITR